MTLGGSLNSIPPKSFGSSLPPTFVDRAKRPDLMGSVPSLDSYPRFLIADDHAMFAEALRVYLEKT